MRAYLTAPHTLDKLILGDTTAPQPHHNEALVRVSATSLNRGEVRMALEMNFFPPNYTPGWDIAGTVEEPAADGSGPQRGQRVVGFVNRGGWAEQVAAPTATLATIPDDLSFIQAATLPVAGLTALHAVYKGGPLLDRKVLVTGASGGVGDFAIQLARLAGARVTAHIRREEQRAFIEKTGADHIAIGPDLYEAAHQYAPFDLAIESVGGKTLGDALAMMAERGTCVLFGTSGGDQVTFNAQKFYNTGGVTLYGMVMGDEFKWVEAGSVGLARLAGLVGRGALQPQISVEESWTELPRIAHDLLERKFLGKAVLHVA